MVKGLSMDRIQTDVISDSLGHRDVFNACLYLILVVLAKALKSSVVLLGFKVLAGFGEGIDSRYRLS